MSEWEAVHLRAKQRADGAKRRAAELRRRYLELAELPGANREQVQDAASAARVAHDKAIAAHRALMEQFEQQASAHDHPAAPEHRHTAETLPSAAHQVRTVHAQLRGPGERSPMRLTDSAVQDICVLTVDGVLDYTTYVPLRDAIVKAALDEPRAVLIDVTELVVREDAAWAVFTSARWQVAEWPDIPIGLVCAHQHGRNALRHNGITRYVEVYPSLQSAITELRPEDLRSYRQRALAALPALKSSGQRCREVTAQWLTAWSRTDFIHAVSIVASELVEIALTAADSEILLRLETGGSTVAVAIQYAGAAPPTGRHSAAGMVCNLDLVAATSRVWGSYTNLAGNTLWAVLGPENRF